jgi:hypothetical protein
MSSRPEHNNLDMEGALASSKKVFERKLEANRRNAQLSTGPRTSEGKAISRFNAVIHGLVGKQLVRALGKDAEGRAEFELVLTEIRALYQPFTVVEELLVEKGRNRLLAPAAWGQVRTRTNEQGVFVSRGIGGPSRALHGHRKSGVLPGATRTGAHSAPASG